MVARRVRVAEVAGSNPVIPIFYVLSMILPHGLHPEHKHDFLADAKICVLHTALVRLKLRFLLRFRHHSDFLCFIYDYTARISS